MDAFQLANDSIRKADYVRWHRHQSRRQILRSQLGFSLPSSSRPQPCQGCSNYHGIAYGYSKDTRTVLICGIHPNGWHGGDTCPDWLGV
ncbi:MAG: hypothetical protein NZ772_05655 [Cyanobacteria bacterium]|nr:hypothetical protein [Cyanobacteriota bacterium]MDW8201531.1 hypothetical protein [Cyanobacteriota bacterium SKYGB_h_bin112]